MAKIEKSDAFGTDSPLDLAVAERDRNTLRMVERALRSKNVRLAYQPVVRATQLDRSFFFEGLVRVLDSTGRPIPAREFITEIETHEIGRMIDCLALELGLNALASEPHLRMSINMSARSIGYRRWREVLEEGLVRVPDLRGRLILEITESSAMVMPDVVMSFMNELHGMGILFALDDFGAGYTSFKYLKSLLFDIIKIDGQFVRDIHHDVDNQVMMQAFVDIAQHFEMFTVAESVESAREAAFLAAAGIDCIQGYHVGAPSMKPLWETKPMDRRARSAPIA